MAEKDVSKVEGIDLRFALVDRDGVERYPYRMHKLDGRVGFVVGIDRGEQGEVVHNIEDVVRAVVFDGKRVRTTDFPPSKAKSSSGLSLVAGRTVQGYRIAPALRHLVAGAPIAPLGEPRGLATGSAPKADTATKVERVSLSELGAGAYSKALDLIEPKMTGAQREMLRGHASAPMQELSMPDIAALGGYSDYAAANSQYGRLGRWFAEALGVEPDALANKVQAICIATDETNAAGHFVWQLRPQLVEALRAAGWEEADSTGDTGPAAAGAKAELEAEPEFAGLPETTRAALVNARIGQGGYRLRMCRIWGDRCAVTGLAVPDALVASHALAWKDSDNHQRLDAYNGLLLSATLDKLFDKGLVSFSDSGALLVKPILDPDELRACGLSLDSKLRFVPERCKPYLKKHRQRFGFES